MLVILYPRFDDVTADEFIQVQTDTSDFRYHLNIYFNIKAYYMILFRVKTTILFFMNLLTHAGLGSF